MVAVRSDPHVAELPDGLFVDRATDLVAAGLDLWVSDAARWLRHGDLLPEYLRGRCESAWRTIVDRPDRVPLVGLAAQLAGVDESVIWRWLWQRSVSAAGL